jgi:beta-glucosidase
MRRIAVAVSAVALLGAVSVFAAGSAGAASTPPYMNPSLGINERVNDLMSRMTLEEKIGQMDQVLVGRLRAATDPGNGDCNGGNDTQPQTSCLERVLVTYKTGSILSGGTDNPPDNTGRGWAELYNTVQHYAIEHSRLHIPIVYGVDAVHGFGHPTEATLFPHEIGLGATWSPALAENVGTLLRRQLQAVGTTWDFAPVQDLGRDNRWGRYYETWSEDKLLAGSMGAANIAGMQGAHGDQIGVAATVKHFAAYGNSVNGHDRVQAEIPIRYLQDTFLPSYGAAVDAGAATVMTQDGSINGIPAYASHFLQTTELRNRLGFEGVVISDYRNVEQLIDNYHTASDMTEAAAQMINAGVDMSMTVDQYPQFMDGVMAAVQRGLISRTRINQAVRRILTLKFRLGLFDHPYVDPAKADAAISANKSYSRQVSQKSLVLLRNEGSPPTLPFSSSVHRIVVTGPNADSIPHQLGGWSVSWQGVFDNHSQECCQGPANQIPPATTVLAGLRQDAPAGTDIVSAPDQASAVSAMSSADAAVVVVGEKAYAEGLGDRPLPRLDADQQSLIAALEATGKPVIVVVIAGRPLGLGPGESANALLMAWQGGTETGGAVADVLFGKVDPSGRLPSTWPSDDQGPWTTGFEGTAPSAAGDRPKFYDQLPGTNSGRGSGYNPAWPIGFGLSYTTFEESNLSAPSSARADGPMSAMVTVKNTGSRSGTDLVAVFASQPVTHDVVVAPTRRLVGFARVTLAPGESQVVRVPIALKMLAVTPGDIESFAPPRVPPGAYTLTVNDMHADFTITG